MQSNTVQPCQNLYVNEAHYVQLLWVMSEMCKYSCTVCTTVVIVSGAGLYYIEIFFYFFVPFMQMRDE